MAAAIPLLDDRQYILPPGAAGDLGYAHAINPFAYGDSVVLAEELDADSVLMGIAAVSFADPFAYNGGVQIAVGYDAGAGFVIGAEFRTRVAQLVNTAGGSGLNWLPCIYGVDAFPQGARLEFRLCKQSTFADGWYVRAGILKKPLAGRLALTDRQYVLPDGAADFTITTGAVAAGTWSAWSGIRGAGSASDAPALYIADFNLGQTIANQLVEFDVAIGDEGDEENGIIHRSHHPGGRMSDLIGGKHPHYVPLYVPAGERLSWRVRVLNSGGASRTVFMSLTYVLSYLDWFEQSNSE